MDKQAYHAGNRAVAVQHYMFEKELDHSSPIFLQTFLAWAAGGAQSVTFQFQQQTSGHLLLCVFSFLGLEQES